MRASNRFLTLLSAVALSLVVSSCGEDFVGQIKCNTDSDCRTSDKLGMLFDTDAGDPALLPMCCSSTCVLPAGGCDTGYRFLDNDPGYGDCVPKDPMCPAPMQMPDLSMPMTD